MQINKYFISWKNNRTIQRKHNVTYLIKIQELFKQIKLEVGYCTTNQEDRKWLLFTETFLYILLNYLYFLGMLRKNKFKN